jgi:hypothetical protein
MKSKIAVPTNVKTYHGYRISRKAGGKHGAITTNSISHKKADGTKFGKTQIWETNFGWIPTKTSVYKS